MSLKITVLLFLSSVIMAQTTATVTAPTPDQASDIVNIDSLFQSTTGDYDIDLKPKII